MYAVGDCSVVAMQGDLYRDTVQVRNAIMYRFVLYNTVQVCTTILYRFVLRFCTGLYVPIYVTGLYYETVQVYCTGLYYDTVQVRIMILYRCVPQYLLYHDAVQVHTMILYRFVPRYIHTYVLYHDIAYGSDVCYKYVLMYNCLDIRTYSCIRTYIDPLATY